MAIVKTDSKNYENAARAIRQQTGSQTRYQPKDLPQGIAQVYEKGYADGRFEGFGEGHTDGMLEGEAFARQRFWDHYQQEGDRTNYTLAFAGVGWNEETFWPHHDITVQNGYQMFAYFAFSGSLKKRLADCKVNLSFSGDKSIMNLFGYADKITELGVIDFSQVTLNYNTHIFNQCKALKTIEKLVVPPGQTTWASWFDGCTALETVIFEGFIVNGGLDLSASTKLSVESMQSVINNLTNMAGTSGTTRKITFGATNLEKLSESDKAFAAQKGWTLV